MIDTVVKGKGVKITPDRHTIAMFKDGSNNKVLITGRGTVDEKENLFRVFTKVKQSVERIYHVDIVSDIKQIKVIHNIKVPVYNIQIVGRNKGSMFNVIYLHSQEYHLKFINNKLTYDKSIDNDKYIPEIKAVSFIFDLKDELGMSENEIKNTIWIETMAHEYAHKLLFISLLKRYGKRFLMRHKKLMSSYRELLNTYNSYDPYIKIENQDYATKLLFYGEGISQVSAELMDSSWNPPPKKYRLYVDSYEHVKELAFRFYYDFEDLLIYVVNELNPPE